MPDCDWQPCTDAATRQVGSQQRLGNGNLNYLCTYHAALFVADLIELSQVENAPVTFESNVPLKAAA